MILHIVFFSFKHTQANYNSEGNNLETRNFQSSVYTHTLCTTENVFLMDTGSYLIEIEFIELIELGCKHIRGLSKKINLT